MKLRKRLAPDDSGRYWRAHLKKDCALVNGNCMVHNPSDHSLKRAYIVLRDDRTPEFFERICKHGCGHPDPDDLAYKISIDPSLESWIGVHGCDGCCYTEGGLNG